MKKNQAVNVLKGLLILSVLYLHVITFIIGVGDSNSIMLYFYSLFSLTVPTFFVISGYFFQKSKNNEKNIKKLIILYTFFSIATYIITNLFFVPIPSNLVIKDFFVFGYYYGYIWFLKDLLIFQMIAYIFITGTNKKYKLCFAIYFLISIIILIVSKKQVNVEFVEIFTFFVGMVLAKTDIKIKPYYAFSVLLLPFVLKQSYNLESQYPEF